MKFMKKVLSMIKCIKIGLQRFCTGDFSLNNASQSGRSAEVYSNQAKTLLETFESLLG